MGVPQDRDRGRERARERLARARRVVLLAGEALAGEERRIPPAPRGIESPEAFFADPARVWAWYAAQRERAAAWEPGAAHRAVAGLEGRLEALTVLTEATDGLFERAGCRRVLGLHGSIWRVRCTRCGGRGEDRTVPTPPLPSCRVCTALVRPDVVWPGERLPEDLARLMHEAIARADVLVVAGLAGTERHLAPAVAVARRAGAWVVAVGIGTAPAEVDAELPGPAAGELAALLEPGP